MQQTWRVLRAFVDESERNEDFYFLGAVVCTDEQSGQIRERLDAVIAKHAESFPVLDRSTEFHASDIMRADKMPWRAVPLRVRFALYTDALKVIEASKVRIYVEGVDVGRQLARGYPNPTPARELAFSHLFERINDCARDAQTTAQVVADEHHTSEISRSNFRNYQSFGTYGYRSTKLALIEPEIRFIRSDSDRSLQAADMVTYLYNRRATIRESDRRAEEQKLLLWQAISPACQWPRGRTRIWP